MLSVKNLFTDIPGEMPEEICTEIVRADSVPDRENRLPGSGIAAGILVRPGDE